MTELPVGWSQCTLQDVGEIVTGNTPSKSNVGNYGDKYPWIKPPDLGSDTPITTTAEKLSEEGAQKARLVPKGTTFVSCIGILGKVGISGATVATNQQINSVVFNSSLVVPQYGFFYCKTLKSWLDENSSSTTVAIINKRRFSEAPFVLAPLNEQRRIVTKLEKLLSRVNAAQERLATIPRILKRFRQSVLAAACSGQLTADWRTENQLHVRDWSVVTLNDVAELRLGKMLDRAKNLGEPTPYLRNLNVRWFRFDLNDLALIRATEQDKRELSIRNGDVLICEGGEPGRCAVWQEGDNNLIFQKALHRVRLKNGVIPEWLVANIRNDANSGRLVQLFTGSTIKHLTGRSLETYSFPGPPRLEQQEIVRRVEALFKTVDALEARYFKAKAHVDKLTQSILAKAFRGELVPQDPNDEPASVLLERITGEPNGSAVVKRRSRK
jgi:type I restriction enzyme S subunit